MMRPTPPVPVKVDDLDFPDLDQRIPPSMPLVDDWLGLIGNRRPLAGATALLIQHQLGNHYVQAKALLELGLDPKRLHWLDIPYTATTPVREALERLGIPRRNFRIHSYKVLDPYPPYQRGRTQKILHELLAARPEFLLVLDDGAYFLEAMATFEERLPRMAVVEQTTRGLIKIAENASLRRCAEEIPIVNVARSKPKLTLEPPFIGRAVCAALFRGLSRHGGDLSGRRCLVLGYGCIGQRVSDEIASRLGCGRERVFVYDPDPARQQLAVNRGFKLWDRGDMNTRFGVVVGCSGRSSFAIGDYVYLDETAVLASASSGSVELSRQDFIELADTSPHDDIEILGADLRLRDVHSDLVIRLPGRRATFLNAGFPVNFDGRVNCIPPRYIQQTVTMMLAGAVQAAAETRNGIVDLDADFCTWLDREFRARLGQEASVLPAAEG